MVLALVVIGFVLLLILTSIAFAALASRGSQRELQEHWGLTDDEVERFAQELPEVERDIAAAVPPGTYSRREIRELAEQSTLKGVLLKRLPKREGER